MTMSSPVSDGSCDVFVIGGGPAGSTIATLLARQGRRVVLADKEHHPRFHIGESLLPANGPLFDRLGVRDEVERMGMPKWGVEFVSPEHDHQAFVEFADALDKTMPSAWQVRRSELDEMLFRHAGKSGALTHEGCRVREVVFDAQGADVKALLDDGAAKTWRARFVVDASGRDTFLANRLDLKRKNPNHNSAAVFGHFRGARRLDGKLAGNISIFWFQHGWFWFIPLADGTTSVGAVCWPYYLKSRDKPMREFFEDTIALCPRLAARLEGAELVDGTVHATGNYSYSSTHCRGERWLALGDAFAFIDPVFSSGVFLAMNSAFEGAEVVAATLDGKPSLAAAQRRFDAVMQQGPKDFSWFIYRMTNPVIRDLFMHPRNVLNAKSAVLTLLAGDIFGKTRWRAPLAVFKFVYYAASVLGWRRSRAAYLSRREKVRDVALRGETVVVPGR
jgi:flavin-dependent dehydrogenase